MPAEYSIIRVESWHIGKCSGGAVRRMKRDRSVKVDAPKRVARPKDGRTNAAVDHRTRAIDIQ
jgi:hypothetical protein